MMTGAFLVLLLQMFCVLSTLDPLTFLLFVQHHHSKADVGMTSRHPFLSDGKGEELAELLLGSFHGI